MSALLAFLAVTVVLGSVLRLRDALRPEPYDAPIWWWRLKLAWRAYRRAHGHHPLPHTRRTRPVARRSRRRRGYVAPCRRAGAAGPGGRVPVLRRRARTRSAHLGAHDTAGGRVLQLDLTAGDMRIRPTLEPPST